MSEHNLRPGSHLDLPSDLAITAGTLVRVEHPDGAGHGVFQVPVFELAGRLIRTSAPTNGTAQVETNTVVAAGGVTASGNYTVTVTSALFDAPVAVVVALLEEDTAAEAAAKIVDALELNETITEHFTPSVSTADVILTAKKAAANDTTLNIALPGALGITADATSANTTAGVLGTVPDFLGQLSIVSGTVKIASDLDLNTWTTIS